ncbi:helix-turn-helix domain-containing protein [Mesorhizobium sp. L-8-3]|uniref:helix-turn-helix domain-containing protein n=1 Tax=Mesorhizobium sp. L-8-3 TaxID=2744522 RepID=UPI001FD33427|nr:helix-turn-helix domain-containing protein [Mesorhizobium sp. L-8-3]
MRRRLTQAKSAQLLVMKQLDISAIVTGRTDKFSIDRPVSCLGRRAYKVDVVVRHKQRKSAPTADAAWSLAQAWVQLSTRSSSSGISISSSSWPISVATRIMSAELPFAPQFYSTKRFASQRHG